MLDKELIFMMEEEDVTMGDIFVPEDGDVEVLCACGQDYFQQ